MRGRKYRILDAVRGPRRVRRVRVLDSGRTEIGCGDGEREGWVLRRGRLAGNRGSSSFGRRSILREPRLLSIWDLVCIRAHRAHRAQSFTQFVSLELTGSSWGRQLKKRLGGVHLGVIA